MPKERPRSPTADRRALANALRTLRERSGLSLEAAASQALEASAAKLSRIETNRQTASPRDVRDLCALYKASESKTTELMTWAASAREPAWWEAYDVNDDDYVGLESAAIRIREFQNSLVPALLQTAEYAEAYVRNSIAPGRSQPWGEDSIRDVLEIRKRRIRTTDTSLGVEMVFVLDESVLLRQVGGGFTLKNQLEHLKSMSEQPNIELRVLPLSVGASPGQLGGFSVLSLPNGPDVAYVESQGGFALIDDADRLKHFDRVFKAVQAASTDPSETGRVLDDALARLP